jgi:hypothetical protein
MIDAILDALQYDPDEGIFRWRRTRKKCPAGKIAGSVRKDGYTAIFVDGKRHYAHRLAFVFMTGEWPATGVDHIDGDPANNRWANLRSATPQQNMWNKRAQSNSTTGLKGVHRHSQTGDFYATIKVDGKHVYLGTYKQPAEAHAAYVEAAKVHFGEFARAA